MQGQDAAALPIDFASRVVTWQRAHGRQGLPWQGTRDAYRIWLSEIMLQQTQVATVLRYYEPFLARFPRVSDLAAAPQDAVLAAWSGLGYYSRARHLHRCAQAVVDQHGGVFPTSSAVLETLPGIGRSTAAAVAAFSSGERAAILDGNVKRVLTRVLGYDQDVARPQGLRPLWAFAEALLPESGIEAYTQGLMDLGATVCLHRRPQCERCPVRADCRAHLQGRPQDYPVKSRHVSRGVRSSVMGLFLSRSGPAPHSGMQILLWRRPSQGVWAGLWSVPEWSSPSTFDSFLQDSGSGAVSVQSLPPVVHALTHLDWTLSPRRMWLAHEAQPRFLKSVEQSLAPSMSAAPVLEWVEVEVALARGLPAPVRRWIEAEAGEGPPTAADPGPDR